MNILLNYINLINSLLCHIVCHIETEDKCSNLTTFKGLNLFFKTHYFLCNVYYCVLSNKLYKYDKLTCTPITSGWICMALIIASVPFDNTIFAQFSGTLRAIVAKAAQPLSATPACRG